MSIVLNKQLTKSHRNVKTFLSRQVHKSFLKDITLSVSERQRIYQKLTKYGYSSSIVRLKNFCMLTGNSRSFYRDVKLSRHQFNQMALNGLIPGCIQLLGKITLYFFMNSNSLAKLVSLIKISLARGRLTAKVPYSNLNFNILKILYFEGYIRGFKVTDSSREIYVFFKLNQFKLSLLDIAYFCSRNKHNYLTYNKLVSSYGLKIFGIVSTNQVL